MSLILEMCRTHKISDTAGNAISCVLAWNCTLNVKFSDITAGNVMFPCFGST